MKRMRNTLEAVLVISGSDMVHVAAAARLAKEAFFPAGATRPVLRLELVLIDPLSGQIITSHVREFSKEE